MTTHVDVLGVSLSTPGVQGWPAFLDVLSGSDPDLDAPALPTTLLSPREHRRCPDTIRMTLSSAEHACAMACLQPDLPDAIFSSAMGDLDINDYICRTLADTPAMLSPTRFHNSVHNAAAGYWSIATGATGDVTAISGWHDSVAVGLIEAATRLDYGSGPVLLVVYDACALGPMRDLWPTRFPFSAALILAQPGRPDPIARLTFEPRHGSDSGSELPLLLAARVADNPAARILPMLALIADTKRTEVVLGAEQGPGVAVRSVAA